MPKFSPDTEHGIELYNEGATEKAIEVLREVVKKHAADADAWYYLGLAYSRDGIESSARPAYAAVIRLRPEMADAHAHLAYTLLLANAPLRAAEEAELATALGAGGAQLHYVIARARCVNYSEASAKTCRTEALSEVEIALKIDPDYAPALLLQSQLLSGQAAVASLEKYLAVAPNDLDAAVWREQLMMMRQSLASPPTTTPTTAETDLPLPTKLVTTKARITSKPEPRYTEPARKAGVAGEVALRIVLSSRGTVEQVRVLSYLTHGLTREAVDAARRIKFEPARKDGHLVSQYTAFVYSFSIY